MNTRNDDEAAAPVAEPPKGEAPAAPAEATATSTKKPRAAKKPKKVHKAASKKTKPKAVKKPKPRSKAAVKSKVKKILVRRAKAAVKAVKKISRAPRKADKRHDGAGVCLNFRPELYDVAERLRQTPKVAKRLGVERSADGVLRNRAAMIDEALTAWCNKNGGKVKPRSKD